MRTYYDFSKLKPAEPRYARRLKKSVTMRLDPQVIAYFKTLAAGLDMPYQSLINFVLKDYANLHLKPNANWRRS